MSLCFALGVVVGAWLDWDLLRATLQAVYKNSCSRRKVHLAKKHDDIPPAYEFAPAPVEHLQEENDKIMQEAFNYVQAQEEAQDNEEEEDSSDDD
jgi:hypothetical protein